MPDVDDREILFEAIERAQAILAAHIEPGGPDEKVTVNDLLETLDHEDVVAAVRSERAEVSSTSAPEDVGGVGKAA